MLVGWSGGKDSTLALERVLQDRRYTVVGLLTTVTAEFDRISMHGVRCALLRAQGEALGIPVVEAPIPVEASCEAYQRSFAEAVAGVRGRIPGVRHMVFGDLFLEDIRAFRERQLAELGMVPLFPLWGEDTGRLARDFIARGYRSTIVTVDPRQVPAELAGRAYDQTLLADLPPSADPCGERGEFHTFVHAGPIFRRPVALFAGEVVTRGGFVFADLLAPPDAPVPV